MAGTSNGNGGRGAVAAITAGVTVTGSIDASAELQIGGRVEGDIRCYTLFVEEDGEIVGDISAERVRVAGMVDGTIEASDIAIESTGRVTGAIIYDRLKIGAGGILEGSARHEPAAAAVDGGTLKLVETEPSEPHPYFVD